MVKLCSDVRLRWASSAVLTTLASSALRASRLARRPLSTAATNGGSARASRIASDLSIDRPQTNPMRAPSTIGDRLVSSARRSAMLATNQTAATGRMASRVGWSFRDSTGMPSAATVKSRAPSVIRVARRMGVTV